MNIRTLGTINVDLERLEQEVININYQNDENITVVSSEMMDKILMARLKDFEIGFIRAEVTQKYLKKEISLDKIEELKSTDKGIKKLLELIGDNMDSFFQRVVGTLYDMAEEPYEAVAIEIDGVEYFVMADYQDKYHLEESA